MLFMIRKKAKNRFYYYLYIYDSSHDWGMRAVFSLGNGDKALNRLAHWQQNRTFPQDLADLGIKTEQVEKWREKIAADYFEKGLQCFTYKSYNENRKRPAAPTEAIS